LLGDFLYSLRQFTEELFAITSLVGEVIPQLAARVVVVSKAVIVSTSEVEHDLNATWSSMSSLTAENGI
jgi:hypothetical protein